MLLLVALLAATPPSAAAPSPDAAALRARATAAYRAGRYADACPAFGAAAKLAPEDAAIAADRGLCLDRLGRRDAAVAETRRAISLARPGTPDAERVRRGAHFNLARFGVAIAVPPEGACAELPAAPGCPSRLHACTRESALTGTGGGTFYTVAVVGRTPEVAAVGDIPMLDAAPEGAVPLTPPPARTGFLPLAQRDEGFGDRECMVEADGACVAYADGDGMNRAERCVRRKGCTAATARECEAWEACVESICPREVKARRARCQPARTDVTATCALVTADACAGVAATVCVDRTTGRPRRVVHEILLAP